MNHPQPIENVFVLCAGRTASTTFARACEHLSNFSAGHETQSRTIGEQRLSYPSNHIEADNRLAWFLGRMEQRYGDAAYVYLRRDPEAVARSYLQRWDLTVSIVRAFGQAVLMRRDNSSSQRMQVCRDYVRTVDENICNFLQRREHVMYMDLENIQEDFPKFLQWIGAQGDTQEAIAEWSRRHNENKRRSAGATAAAIAAKLGRIATGFPSWLRSV